VLLPHDAAAADSCSGSQAGDSRGRIAVQGAVASDGLIMRKRTMSSLAFPSVGVIALLLVKHRPAEVVVDHRRGPYAHAPQVRGSDDAATLTSPSAGTSED